MSTTIIALLLVSGIIVISLIFSFMSNQESKKRMHKMLFTFSELGTQYNLSFTSQEVLKQRIIGLDGLNRKLLLLAEENGKYDWDIIDLNEVKSCTVKMTYSRINAGDLDSKKLADYMENIALEFEFKTGRQNVSLPFYTAALNHIFEMGELEEKAKGWEAMLSKLLIKENSHSGIAI
jgi:hypothetical protein